MVTNAGQLVPLSLPFSERPRSFLTLLRERRERCYLEHWKRKVKSGPNKAPKTGGKEKGKRKGKTKGPSPEVIAKLMSLPLQLRQKVAEMYGISPSRLPSTYTGDEK